MCSVKLRLFSGVTFLDYFLVSLTVTIWSSQMANKTVRSCSNKKGVRTVNKLLAKSKSVMHVVHVSRDSKCQID